MDNLILLSYTCKYKSLTYNNIKQLYTLIKFSSNIFIFVLHCFIIISLFLVVHVQYPYQYQYTIGIVHIISLICEIIYKKLNHNEIISDYKQTAIALILLRKKIKKKLIITADITDDYVIYISNKYEKICKNAPNISNYYEKKLKIMLQNEMNYITEYIYIFNNNLDRLPDIYR